MKPIHNSLSQLGKHIQEIIEQGFIKAVWVIAEIAECREHAGHCYLELIEKDEQSNEISARMRAQIWSTNYRLIKPYFETTTSQPFGAGIKVLLQVKVDFHELYGIRLTVKDIDPSFTLGESARRKLEILRRLKEEGSLNMNRELPFPELPQRIAIISSETAAGYGDFMDQLMNNTTGFVFYTKLFPTLMQGAGAEQSVIGALNSIANNLIYFDVVVIIRGGGAVVDLATFDNYNMATHVAQFPLPIIVGIGHERDETILDHVAHTRVKTPTAVAELLIEHQQHAYSILHQLGTRIPQLVQEQLNNEQMKLQRYQQKLNNLILLTIQKQKHLLEIFTKKCELLDPKNILKMGYSITYHQGKILRNTSQINAGDLIKTQLEDGTITSTINVI